MKHTPAPWEYSTANAQALICDCYGNTIAHLLVEENTAAHNNLKANARLIAAAPNLLDALIDCVAVMESELKGLAVIQPELAYARAAIAKATGEQH